MTAQEARTLTYQARHKSQRLQVILNLIAKASDEGRYHIHVPNLEEQTKTALWELGYNVSKPFWKSEYKISWVYIAYSHKGSGA